jgi:hypothetical protein
VNGVKHLAFVSIGEILGFDGEETKALAMKFVQTGFSQGGNVRQYSFQGIATGGKRTALSVGVDLTLIHKYRIPLQEVPLLCSAFLAAQSTIEPGQGLTLPEDFMRTRVDEMENERMRAQIKKKAAPAPLPLPEPDHEPAGTLQREYGKTGIGLGSRPAYPWSSYRPQATTKR